MVGSITEPSSFAGSPPQSSSNTVDVSRNLSSLQLKYASKQDALEGLTAFVRSLGVDEPATNETGLLMQAAPYMSESLAANLQSAWTPEERERLDAAPVPAELDHQNRDHEYIFFKQMRQSLERRLSRSSSNNSTRGSRDLRSLDRLSRDASSPAQPTSFAACSTAVVSPEGIALQRAEQRRSNLGAVWGETGRDVLKALDTLPESDVLLDEDNITPPDSPKYATLDNDVDGKEGMQRTSSSPAPNDALTAPGGYGLTSFGQAKQWVSLKARRASFSLSKYWDQKK